MQFDTQSRGIVICDRTRTELEHALVAKLGRLVRRLRAASLVIAACTDEETDRQTFVCGLRLVLTSRAPILVHSVADTYQAAFAGVARRARVAILDRRRELHPLPPASV